jgi:hypothetical protein
MHTLYLILNRAIQLLRDPLLLRQVGLLVAPKHTGPLLSKPHFALFHFEKLVLVSLMKIKKMVINKIVQHAFKDGYSCCSFLAAQFM